MIPRLAPVGALLERDEVSQFEAHPHRLPLGRETWTELHAKGVFRILLDPAIPGEHWQSGGELEVLWRLQGHPAIEVLGLNRPGTVPLMVDFGEDGYLTAERPTGGGSFRGAGGMGPDMKRLLPRFAGRLGVEVEALRRALNIQAACGAADIDVLLTDDPLLRPEIRFSSPPLAPDANSFQWAEALAAIGLFLRSRGDFTIRHVDGAAHVLSPDRFFGDAAQQLVPAVHEAGRLAPPATRTPATTCIRRLGRFLRARDRVHVAAQRPLSRRSHEEVAEALESALVQLVAAFEALEKASAASIGVAPDRSRVERREEMKGTAVGQAIEDDRYYDWRKATSELRNTLHDEVIYAATIRSHESEGTRAWLIISERSDDDSFGDRTRKVLLADDEAWVIAGMLVETEHLSLVDPAALVEVLADRVTTQLNNVGLALLAELDGYSVVAPPKPPEVAALIGVGVPEHADGRAAAAARVEHRSLVPGRDGEPLLTAQDPSNFRHNISRQRGPL